MVREPDATMQPAPQDNQLMSKYRVLSLKPQLRLEWRGQGGQSEIEEPDHSASLGDSITSSTRIRFSVPPSLIWSALVLLFRSRASLAAEILVLRHQINILRRHSPKRQTFSAMDRLLFAGVYRLAPTVLNALAVLNHADGIAA